MKIQSIQNNYCKNATFKKGLTTYEINQVKNMKPFEYVDIAENLKRIHGIHTNFAECNTVAWCVNELVKIMTKAGFELPRKFSFAQLGKYKQLGQYDPVTREVAINSDYVEFTNLESQNYLEESQGNFHPRTKHFLQTYLHEFSHAAHFQHLCDKHGFDRAWEIVIGYYENHKAKDIIVEPVNTLLGKLFGRKIVDGIVPLSNGEYATTNLNEYFAEKNARKLAEQLGESYLVSNVKENSAYEYIGHNAYDDFYPFMGINMNAVNNANIMNTLFRIAIIPTNFLNPVGDILETVRKINTQIELVDGDIYHGNVDFLKKSIFST